MAKTDRAAPLKKGDRVVVTRPLKGVPEGATGTVKISNGLTWDRYWVQWDNGIWQGSVSGAALVRASDWEEFKRRRAEEAARPKAEASPEPASAASADKAAAGGAASRVPAHLLERSAKARARSAG